MPTWGTGEFGEQNPWGGVFGFDLPPPDVEPPDVGDEIGADLCIHNHREQALSRLVEQFKDKPGIEALISAYIAPIQRLEDTLCQMLHERALAAGGEPRTAVGAQLDLLGKIVGFRQRGQLNDDEYERLIEAMKLANKSNGVIEDFIAITILVTNIDEGIVVRRFSHATLVITPTEDISDSDEADFLMRFLHRAASGGVRIILIFYPDEQENLFTFSGGAGQGFGDGVLAGARSNGLTNQPVTE